MTDKEKTKLVLTRPADKSLQAYKDFITSTLEGMGISLSDDKKMSEDEWKDKWQEFWRKAEK